MRVARWLGFVGFSLMIAGGCSSDDDNGGDGGSSGSGTGGTAATDGGAATGGTTTGGTAGSGVGGTAGGNGGCVVTTCQGHVYQCGDCIDNDGDGKIDVGADLDCLGPCHNAESTFYGSIPGQAGPACTVDCYFDQDSGAGNDACYWNHECDPLSVAPNYPPEGPDGTCSCEAGKPADPNWACSASTPGTGSSCYELYQQQSDVCEDFCGPLTPNGCDCFGCCELPAESGKYVWLGSEINDQGSCDLQSIDDPTKCQPCTPVAACLNKCEHCEFCLGKPVLPADCSDGGAGTGGSGGCPPDPLCSNGETPCDYIDGCLAPCPPNYFCQTGCCQPIP